MSQQESTVTCETNRLRFLSAFLVVTGLAWGAVSVADEDTAPVRTRQASGGKVYVADQASNQVTVIDGNTFEVIATVPVGDRPHNVNHTPDGRFVLVTNKNVNIDRPPSVSFIRTDTDEVVATVEGIGKRIEHVVAPTVGRAYVTEDLGKNAVLVLDLDERSVVASVSVGVKPHGLWPTPDGRYLFVPNQLSGTVSKVDTETLEVVGEARVGRTPTMVAVEPDGRRAYVTLYGERGLAVLDVVNVESGRMQVNDVIPVGEQPAQVAVTPDGRFVLVPCEGPGALYVVSTNSHEVEVIPTGGKAHGVDVSADGRYAFVTNWSDNSVSVVDLERQVVIREVPVGKEPAGVDYVPTTR
ncbi:MAG: beta-propeller fold lactonase family protein [Methyloprofundus sp.]|nr:beta-propeller fold lactonase family protein [Methyloprofundus sp.]